MAEGIVLIIDEVDAASNNQVFIDFLVQLRFYYLKRRSLPVFQSVILAGVYDVRSVKSKIRPEDEHKENSPWNIAADFHVDMSFSVKDIEGMLNEYETDHQTGMDIHRMAGMIYDYTSGYPYLVSRFCSYLDGLAAQTGEFPDKGSAWTLEGFHEAKKKIVKNDMAVISNRIFETVLYNYFIAEEFADSKMYNAGVQERNQS